MTDQISFLPMLEPRDTSFEDNERKASLICDEEFERADGDIVTMYKCRSKAEKFGG